MKNVISAHDGVIWSILDVEREGELWSSGGDSTIKIWKNYKLLKTIKTNKTVRVMCKYQDDLIASGSYDGEIELWDLKGEKIISKNKMRHDDNVYSLKYNERERELISCGEDSCLKVWKEEICVQKIEIPSNTIWSIDYLDNNIICGCSDRSVYIFTRDQRYKSDHNTEKKFIEKFQEKKNQIELTSQNDFPSFVTPGEMKDLPLEISSWLGDFKRVGVYADGNCFYHSLFQLIDQQYHSAQFNEQKRNMGYQKRKDLAKKITKGMKKIVLCFCFFFFFERFCLFFFLQRDL